MKIRSVALIGLVFGLAGAAGQILLSRVGLYSTAPLRGILTVLIPTAIGILIGICSPRNPSATAAVAGVIAGVPATLAELGSILMRIPLTGQAPFSSIESFLLFASTIIAATTIWSWLLGCLAALVALACSQSSVQSPSGAAPEAISRRL